MAASVIYQDNAGFYYRIWKSYSPWGYQDISQVYEQYEPYEFHILSNAEIVYNMLADYGYSHKAIVAILSNMIAESSMNPAQGEVGYPYMTYRGYGLCQWTPATDYTSWCQTENHDVYLGQYQVEYFDETAEDRWRINPNYNYNLTWEEFKVYDSTEHSAEWLSMAFFHNYERGTALETYRQYCAYWYDNYFQGYTPAPPPPYDPTPYKRYRVHGMPLWMMLKRKEIYQH